MLSPAFVHPSMRRQVPQRGADGSHVTREARRFGGQAGFTLIELLVAMPIALIVVFERP